MPGTLPNLLIAGVPKGGTSSVFRYLAQHPEICASSVKEIGYFNSLRSDGGTLPPLDSYMRFFSHYKGERYALEATPSYCYAPSSLLQGIDELLNHPRSIIVLRDPVDRLWSAYAFQRAKGHLAGLGSFEEYVSVCEQERQKGEQGGRYFGGVTISAYGDYIPLWLDRFGDATKIIFADDLFTDPAATTRDVCVWLGLDVAVTESFDYSVYNRTYQPRHPALNQFARAAKHAGTRMFQRVPAFTSRVRNVLLRANSMPFTEELRPHTREQLRALYRDSNRALAVALFDHGYRSFPPWLSAALDERPH